MSRILICAAALLFTASTAWGQAAAGKLQRPVDRLHTIKISPETTFVTGPLDAQGRVDFLAAVNQRLAEGVTPQNNAAVLLRRAVGPGEIAPELQREHYRRLGIRSLPQQGEYLVPWHRFAEQAELPVDLLDQLMSRPWTAKDFPTAARWLAANEAPLALVTQATTRSRYYSPLLAGDATPKLISALLPAIQESRGIARVLIARAMFRLGEGEFDAAAEDLLAIHRLARLISQDGTLVGGLVAIAIDSIAHQGDLVLASQAALTAQQASAYLEELSKLSQLQRMQQRIAFTERLMFLDAVSSMAQEGGLAKMAALSGQLPEQPNRFAPLDNVMRWVTGEIHWNIALRSGNQWYDRLATAFEAQSYGERMAALEQMEGELKDMARQAKSPLRMAGLLFASESQGALVGQMLGESLLALLLPAAKAAAQAEYRGDTLQDFSRLALALAAYRVEVGEYPEKLDALAGTHLRPLPHDRFHGGPLQYTRRGDGYLLYSVGYNGQDDQATSFISQTIRGQPAGAQTVDRDAGDDLVMRMPVASAED